MELKTFITDLSNAHGISGFEQEVSQEIKKSWEKLADEVKIDTLGNVIALKKGEKKDPHQPIMLAAHQDEIGFLVKEIDEKGFVFLEPIGGVDPRLLPGQEVIIHGKEPLKGIVGAKPPHLQKPEDRSKAIPMEKLFVDCGRNKEDLEGKIKIGTFVSFAEELEWMGDNICTGKALDDRAGIAALHQALLELQGQTPPLDIAFVATVQEEVGLKGAVTSSFALNPAIGLAIDVGFAHRPGLDREATIESNKGPGLGWGPHVHPGIYKKLEGCAIDNDIPYQMEASPFPGGTDTYAIQMNRCGVATGLLSIPLANMHTPVEAVDMRDVRRTGKILARFCMESDAEFVEGLKWL